MKTPEDKIKLESTLVELKKILVEVKGPGPETDLLIAKAQNHIDNQFAKQVLVPKDIAGCKTDARALKGLQTMNSPLEAPLQDIVDNAQNFSSAVLEQKKAHLQTLYPPASLTALNRSLDILITDKKNAEVADTTQARIIPPIQPIASTTQATATVAAAATVATVATATTAATAATAAISQTSINATQSARNVMQQGRATAATAANNTIDPLTATTPRVR